jgi:hypothetical protein
MGCKQSKKKNNDDIYNENKINININKYVVNDKKNKKKYSINSDIQILNKKKKNNNKKINKIRSDNFIFETNKGGNKNDYINDISNLNKKYKKLIQKKFLNDAKKNRIDLYNYIINNNNKKYNKIENDKNVLYKTLLSIINLCLDIGDYKESISYCIDVLNKCTKKTNDIVIDEIFSKIFKILKIFDNVGKIEYNMKIVKQIYCSLNNLQLHDKFVNYYVKLDTFISKYSECIFIYKSIKKNNFEKYKEFNKKNNNNITNECYICCVEYEQKTQIYILSCNHVYHLNCMRAWILRNKTCPMCKRYIFRPNIQ